MNALKTGITTGTCAAIAAKAAVMLLATGEKRSAAEVLMPDGSRLAWPVADVFRTSRGAKAAVVKDAGDDPDITHGTTVIAEVRWSSCESVRFFAGEGVGTVTRAGLAVPPGEPAINPGPRKIIEGAIREVTNKGVDVTLSIPGGEELAEKTFNPRLGIKGGLSILGTSGRVRPFSVDGLQESLKCALSVADACGIGRPVLVPGHIGRRAAMRHFRLVDTQVVEVSNEWGFMLDEARRYPFRALLALGHPGKLAKLAKGEWQTHSARSSSAVPYVSRLAEEVLGRSSKKANTIEGLFMELPENDRKTLGGALAGRIRSAIAERREGGPDVAVVLVNLKGVILGSSGELQPWK